MKKITPNPLCGASGTEISTFANEVRFKNRPFSSSELYPSQPNVERASKNQGMRANCSFDRALSPVVAWESQTRDKHCRSTVCGAFCRPLLTPLSTAPFRANLSVHDFPFTISGWLRNRTGNRKPEPSEPFFLKPKEAPELPEPFSRNRNRNRPLL